MKIDLGSGWKPMPGWTTLDCRGRPDIVADLEDAAGTAAAIRAHAAGDVVLVMRASHVLEHVRSLCPLMDALWEVLAPGGLFDIYVPHRDHGSAWHDPTHVRYFTEHSFSYFVAPLVERFRYVAKTWEMVGLPRRLDDYGQPTEGAWATIGVTLRRPL